MHDQIGKFLVRSIALLCLLYSVSYAQAEVTLTITLPSGAACTRVGVGSPCILKVQCQGRGPIAFPAVEGLQSFRIDGRSKSMNIINGSTSTTYNYQLSPIRPGQYVIGPVHVVIDGTTHSSNTVSLAVISQEQAAAERTAVEKAPLLLMRVRPERATVVKGQAVQGTLCLYYRADQPQNGLIIDQIDTPEWPALGITIESASQKEQVKLDGVDYICFSWQWHMTPNRIGSITIPACAAMCRIPNEDLYTGWNILLSGGYKQHRLYSNAAHLQVKELPPCNHPVHAIGSFTTMHAALSSSTVKQADAVTLTISFTGRDTVSEFPLQDMPAALRWYDGKKTITNNAVNNESTTTFEFVIQGMHDGIWHIPSQVFHYFDPSADGYKKLQTHELRLRVIPSGRAQQPDQQKSSATPAAQLQEQTKIAAVTIPPIIQGSLSASNTDNGFSWLLFLILVLFPLIVLVGYYGCYQRFGRYRHQLSSNKRAVFAHARSELNKAWRAGDASRVYAIFIDIWVRRFSLPSADIDQVLLQRPVHNFALPEDQREAWDAFVVRMMAMAYAQNKIHDDTFYKQALEWLDRLYPYI